MVDGRAFRADFSILQIKKPTRLIEVITKGVTPIAAV